MSREEVLRIELTYRIEHLTTDQVAKALGISADAIAKRQTRKSKNLPDKMTQGKWDIDSVIKLMANG